MKTSTKLIFQAIELKVNKLLAENKQLLHELEELKKSESILKSEIQQQKNTIETLQTQNKISKLAEMLSSTKEDKKVLKQKLNTYVKQIDECIRLLSE
ncbi:MAG: hypothetical protein H3C45_03905 [Bacteroidia bacterium]|nr:hypothetical protein [Bacteroidia bacterium]MCC7533998.1 hypothetical protein [Bacteroidia bacterium]